MSDLIERLRTVARKACERHNRVDQFDPTWERKPKDFIEWEAADEIERLKAAVDAAKDMASDYERYEPRGDNWLDYPLHDVDILAKWKARLAALDTVDESICTCPGKPVSRERGPVTFFVCDDCGGRK